MRKLSNEVRGDKQDTESKQKSVCIKAYFLRVRVSNQWSKLPKEMTRGLQDMISFFFPLK